jgi:hypothetical protein
VATVVPVTSLPASRPASPASAALALLGLVSVLVLLGPAAGPATAGPPQAGVSVREPVARSLTLAVNKKTVVKGKKVKLTGAVVTSDATCGAGQVLEVQRSTSGASYPTVGTVTTDAAGAYSFAIKVTKKARFRVSVAATATCSAAQSPPRTVAVTKPAN